MTNDYHKMKEEDSANFHEKMEENENKKALNPLITRYFFEEKENIPQKRAKIIREKRKGIKISAKRLTYFRNMIK